MVRTEISLFLKNTPGELGRLTSLFAQAGIHIDAITIQDASDYVKELFKARGRSLKRIASAASYNSMSKDSAEFALIRLLPADGATNRTLNLLTKYEYLFDIMPVLAIPMSYNSNKLAGITNRLGQAGININYVYGSMTGAEQSGLLIICPEDIDEAAKLFKKKNGKSD